MKSFTTIIYSFLLCILAQSTIAQATLIPSGSSWKFLDNGSDQGTNWKEKSFNDATWASGNAKLGYGDGDENTIVSFGPSATNKYITTYFRKTFEIQKAAGYISYDLNVKRDDGVIVYINGLEVYRDNMPVGPVTYNTQTTIPCTDDGAVFLTKNLTLAESRFVDGTNTIAVEIHQSLAISEDMSFDFSLIGNLKIKHVRWGSNVNPLEGLTITWRNTSTADKIKWGYTEAYEQGVFSAEIRDGYEDKFFKYTFESVTPDATIYYQLYDSAADFWTAGKTYSVAPALNTTDFTFLAIGDSRSGLDIWSQIATLADSKKADFTIFNGDIVDDGGANSEWNDWFDYGKTFIDNNLVFHALGNHDAESVPTYSNIFEFPKSEPVNGTNLYYSFTYGDAVFISLNSEDPDSDTQYKWLLSTLEANSDKKWKIIFFHKPFYTIGTHYGEMDAYFDTWWKAFDDYGVDFVVNGHDHMYERSKPINRNISTTSAVASYGSGPTDGRCEIVCGGAGAPLYPGVPMWFIETYKTSYNFCKFEVTENSICTTAFDENNNILDEFCISKATLGTSDVNQNFYPIKVYPNPVVDNISLEYSSPDLGTVNIRIFDLNGRVIMNEKAEKTNELFSFSTNVAKYQRGVYNLELSVGNQKDSSLIILK
jgi:hypothetical protein